MPGQTQQQRDTTVMKVSSAFSPKGRAGQTYLASGKRVSMRLWAEQPSQGEEPPHSREYETVGYVLEGRAELRIEGQLVMLEPGDSWLVPPGASHSYRILETFKAVEATTPPAQVHARDERASGTAPD
jgi:quercetin dioxygenase-like cupin family protein